MELGADAMGVVGLPAELRADYYREWISAGRHADMAWMAREPERRCDPNRVLPEARSVVVFGFNYFQSEPKRRGRIAKYALGGDYHRILLRKLKQICLLMREAGGEQRPYVDTGPVLEKPLAALAGLGWQGKNTVLLSRSFGQWLFLGVIVTTLELEADEAGRAQCGRCTRCIDACPTGAIFAPYQLDARRCISYLTIEHRGGIPLEFRKAIGDRLFGCDDCLDVCPWNRFARETREARFHAREHPDPAAVLDWNEATFLEAFAGSPLRRPGLQGWKRNACIVLGNIGTHTDLPALQRLALDEDPMLAEHAEWAIGQIRQRAI